MAFNAALIAAAALGGFGIAEAVQGAQSKPSQPSLPATPKPEDAQKTADTALSDQRRMLLLTGGQTAFTPPGGAPILSSDVQTKSLLGG